MRLLKSSLPHRVFLLTCFLLFSSLGVAAQTTNLPARITQPVDEKNLIVLPGNVHPLARPEFDQGPVADAQPMRRMLLLLQRSRDQEAALRQLLDDQQSKSSPNYHVWLTPDQFGKQFGPADADIQSVTAWLQSQGFQVSHVTSGRTVIEFSGNAGQVRKAFHTEIHRFVIEGKEFTANASDSQIPAALSPVVAGIVSLHNFPKKSHAKFLGQFRRTIGKAGLQPLFTFPSPFGGGNFFGLGPGDFATIYNSKPLIAAGNDGTGQTIAIVGETNINVLDIQQFRQMFGLPANFDSTNVILNGEDPGITSIGEEGEADLDVEWSGAVAPAAIVKFVVSASTPVTAGIDLSALYIIENNMAGAMSESYGECEKNLGSAGNAFYNALWEQAAAQGITAILSSGDGGSAGCDNFDTQQVATQGLAVSGLASTPFNVSAGGTDFDEVDQWSSFWNTTNDVTTGASAKSYIPEIPWNENCAQIALTGCGASAPQGSLNIVAGSGGPSSLYAKPKWQIGVAGMPNDNHRDQPDISLFASPGFNGSGYIYCQSDQTFSTRANCDLNLNLGSLDFGIVGGTSASAPAFAGIMALVNQYQAAHGGSNRQGNANYVLYSLAKKAGATCTSSTTEASACVFNDVTKGNSVLPTGATGVGTNSVPCQGGSLNCSVPGAASTGVLVDPSHTTTEAWTAAAGYDMTTGLGTVNASNLATNWGTVSTVPTSTALTLAPATGISHGANENVSVNINVTPKSGTATGDVSLIANVNGPTEGLAQFTLGANGAVSTTTQSLPGGTYTVTAHYAGDGTNAPSDSNAVSVTVGSESSKTFANLVTFDINGNPTSFSANGSTYGSGYAIFRVDVADAASTLSSVAGIASNCSKRITNCPTGTIGLTSSGSGIGSSSMLLNNLGFAETLPLAPGNYSFIASYPGDASYGPSMTNVSFAVAQAPTTIIPDAAESPVQLGNFTQIDASIVTTSDGIGPTGTVQFLVDGVPFGGPIPIQSFGYNPHGNPPYAFGDATSGTEFDSVGNHTLAAQYSGDTNYAGGTSNPITINVAKGFPEVFAFPSPNQINVGQQTTLMGQVVGTARTVTPTGTLTFSDGNTIIPGTVTYTTQPGTLNASLPYAPTSVGAHQITAVYSGDSNYQSFNTLSSAILTVIGPDFSITSSGTTTQIVSAGQTATFANVISISPVDGFASQVNLTCSLSSNATATTCAVVPASFPAGSGTATVNVTTMARGLVPPILPTGRLSQPRGTPPLLPILLFTLLLLSFTRARRQRLSGAFALILLLSLLTLHALGCGGGGSSLVVPPPPPTGTPPGNFPVTVTATATINGAVVTHTTTLTLLVQ